MSKGTNEKSKGREVEEKKKKEEMISISSGWFWRIELEEMSQ